MPAFFASLIDLCRFRRGPADVPYSPPRLVGLLVACGVLQVLFNVHQGVAPRMAAGALIGGLVVVGVLYLFLRARGKAARFVQTATAVAGVYLVFGIVADALALGLPLKTLRDELVAHPDHPPTLTGAEILILLAVFALGIWQLCVWVRILRQALEVSTGGAVLVFLLLLLADWLVLQLVAAAIGAA